jgi:CRP-like cAMP-binding protein
MTSEPSIAPAFQDLDIFRGFTAEEVETVTQAATTVTLEVGQNVFARGETTRALFIVVRGLVRIEMPDVPPEESLVVELSPVAVFGESNFFHEHPHQTNAVCAAATELLRIDRPLFDTWLAEGRSVAYKLATNAAEILASRLYQTDQWLHDNLHHKQEAHASRSWRDFRSHMTSRYQTRGRMGFGLGM